MLSFRLQHSCGSTGAGGGKKMSRNTKSALSLLPSVTWLPSMLSIIFFLQNLGRQSKEKQYFAKKLCKPHLANVIISNSGTLLRPKPWTSSALDICGNTPFPRPFSTVYVQCCLSIFHCTVKTQGSLKQNSSEDASPSYYLFYGDCCCYHRKLQEKSSTTSKNSY